MRMSWIGSLLLFGVVGCAAPRIAGIPLGHWSGKGEFIAVSKGDASTQPAPDVRRYQTTLDIREGSGPASGRIVFEIQSSRGPIDGLDGDRTRLVFELEPSQTFDDGRVRTYRITRAGVSGDETPPTLDEAPEGVSNATGFSEGGRFALYVPYQFGEWHDVFQFRGNQLTKAGALESESDQYVKKNVYWFEELTRR